MPKLNPSIETIPVPTRIANLPVGPNGYPVPWFVAWVKVEGSLRGDLRPEFRAADERKLVRAVEEKRCWVCGEPLGKYMTFVAGPMCGLNRTSAEPPSHTDCARYAARACPFLARPHMERREGGVMEHSVSPAGEMIRRNPGVTLLWTTRGYSLFGDGRGGILFRLGDPCQPLEWFAGGRAATRAEVAESVRTGLPVLEGMARRQDAEDAAGAAGAAGALTALTAMAAEYENLYPKE